jgi:hypothetical protein
MPPPELRHKRKMSRIIASIQHCREVVTCAIRQENEMKGIKKGTKHHSLFKDGIMVCKGNLKVSKDNANNRN